MEEQKKMRKRRNINCDCNYELEDGKIGRSMGLGVTSRTSNDWVYISC